jgi:hypothetical protein
VPEVNFILKEFQETLTRFKEDENKWENNTKAAYIKKCAELLEAQIEAKIIDIKVSGISSYLFKKVTEFGIEVSERTIQRNLSDTYKQNYTKSDTLTDLEDIIWNEIPTTDDGLRIEKNQFNEFKINGKEQRNKAPKKEIISTVVIKKEKDSRQYTYLTAMSKLANKIHLTFETLKSRYNESDEIQALIDKELGDVEVKLTQYAKDWAVMETSKGMIDLRRDYGEYEKITACFMIETGETIARISQLMDYSEKYGSIGILREPQVREFFEKEDTYPLYLRTCPKCMTDISKTMNENISLYRECKDLNITLPIIKYS